MMKINKRIILFCSLLILAALVASISPARADDMLSGYGMQITYNITGATLKPLNPDTPGMDAFGLPGWERDYTGTLATGSRLTVSGSFHVDPGVTVSSVKAGASVTVGSNVDGRDYPAPSNFNSGWDQRFSAGITVSPNVPLPSTGSLYNAGFIISITIYIPACDGCTHDVTGEALLIVGQLSAPTGSSVLTVSSSISTTETTTTAPTEVACDPSDTSQYTQVGLEYKIQISNVQTDHASYKVGDQPHVTGIVSLNQRGVLLDENCPGPAYPVAYGDWESGDPSQVQVTAGTKSWTSPAAVVTSDGTFGIVLDLSQWTSVPTGDYPFTLTATGPVSWSFSGNGSPSEADASFTIHFEGTSSATSVSSATTIVSSSTIVTCSNVGLSIGTSNLNDIQLGNQVVVAGALRIDGCSDWAVLGGIEKAKGALDDNQPIDLIYIRPDGTKILREVTTQQGIWKDTFVPDKVGTWTVDASYPGYNGPLLGENVVIPPIGSTGTPISFKVLPVQVGPSETGNPEPSVGPWGQIAIAAGCLIVVGAGVAVLGTIGAAVVIDGTIGTVAIPVAVRILSIPGAAWLGRSILTGTPIRAVTGKWPLEWGLHYAGYAGPAEPHPLTEEGQKELVERQRRYWYAKGGR